MHSAFELFFSHIFIYILLKIKIQNINLTSYYWPLKSLINNKITLKIIYIQKVYYKVIFLRNFKNDHFLSIF
jgi:hypothetical protein